MTENDTNEAYGNGFLMLKNIYVDMLMALLTGEEYKVLVFAIRRIEGFHKEHDFISISQFTKGIKSIYNKDKVLSLGTGLRIETVRKSLASLVVFGLLIKIDRNNPITNSGELWAVQKDPEKIKWDALKERLEQKSTKNAKRMTKARSSRRLSEQTQISIV